MANLCGATERGSGKSVLAPRTADANRWQEISKCTFK
jgi:hypothetical protein